MIGLLPFSFAFVCCIDMVKCFSVYISLHPCISIPNQTPDGSGRGITYHSLVAIHHQTAWILGVHDHRNIRLYKSWAMPRQHAHVMQAHNVRKKEAEKLHINVPP